MRCFATRLAPLQDKNRGAALASRDGEGQADDTPAHDDDIPGFHSRNCKRESSRMGLMRGENLFGLL